MTTKIGYTFIDVETNTKARAPYASVTMTQPSTYTEAGQYVPPQSVQMMVSEPDALRAVARSLEEAAAEIDAAKDPKKFAGRNGDRPPVERNEA